jgi:hypothetical protein
MASSFRLETLNIGGDDCISLCSTILNLMPMEGNGIASLLVLRERP